MSGVVGGLCSVFDTVHKSRAILFGVSVFYFIIFTFPKIIKSLRNSSIIFLVLSSNWILASCFGLRVSRKNICFTSKVMCNVAFYWMSWQYVYANKRCILPFRLWQSWVEITLIIYNKSCSRIGNPAHLSQRFCWFHCSPHIHLGDWSLFIYWKYWLLRFKFYWFLQKCWWLLPICYCPFWWMINLLRINCLKFFFVYW